MINELVKQIYKSLENDCYMTALTTALILPDVCGKAAYPNEPSSRQRYIQWFDDNIGQYEKDLSTNPDMPYLNGEIVWDLRCSLIHEGNPNLKTNKTHINSFVLMWHDINSNQNMSGFSRVDTNDDGQIIRKVLSMDIRRICLIICETAKQYYKININKFNFFNYRIVNTDKELSDYMNNIL